MGKVPQWAFFQRRHTDGQQAHENVLNITNYQENANQNHNEIPPHTCQKGYFQKEITSVEEVVKKRELSFTVSGKCKLVQPLWKMIWRVLENLKIELPYDPAIPLLDG